MAEGSSYAGVPNWMLHSRSSSMSRLLIFTTHASYPIESVIENDSACMWVVSGPIRSEATGFEKGRGCTYRQSLHGTADKDVAEEGVEGGVT